LLENHEIRALVDNRNETIGKKIRDAEMQKSVYADCRREEKWDYFYPSSWTEKERKYHRYNRRIVTIVNEEINKTLKVFTV
jgi:threonyl-tRNA synthetase